MATAAPLQRNAVTVIGNAAAPRTIAFVHGFGTDQTAGHQVVAPFLADFRVVLLDNVGAGRSDPTAFVQHRYLTLERYATDVLEVLEALDATGAVLVGHSVGAMICVLAARRSPARVSRLVLIAASPRYLDEPGYRGGFTDADLQGLYSAVHRGYPEWVDSFAPVAMGNPDRPQLALYFAATLKSIRPEHALTVLCSIFQSDHRPDIQGLTQPSLLIHSREDIAVPMEVAEYLSRAIPRSRLEVIDATGHLPHISAPAAVLAAMQPFVREALAP